MSFLTCPAQLNPWHPTYDVTSDGGRFLMARSVPNRETELSSQLSIGIGGLETSCAGWVAKARRRRVEARCCAVDLAQC